MVDEIPDSDLPRVNVCMGANALWDLFFEVCYSELFAGALSASAK